MSVIYVLNHMQPLERMPFMAQNAVFRKPTEMTETFPALRVIRFNYFGIKINYE